MKKLLFLIPLLLLACDDPVKTEQPKIEKQLVSPAPSPAPLDDNPFIKKTSPGPAAPAAFQTPSMKGVGHYRLNDYWGITVWRDEPNNVTCYIMEENNAPYNTHNISCVKN